MLVMEVIEADWKVGGIRPQVLNLPGVLLVRSIIHDLDTTSCKLL
jgi:hypothetical protein